MSPETFMIVGVVLLGASVAIVDLILIVSICKSPKGVGSKTAWTLLVLLLPLIGWAIWGRYGPRGLAQAPSSPEQSK